MTKTEAQEKLNQLQIQYDKLEYQMTELALEHELDLYLEGRGRLLLEDNNWTGKSRGEWYTSTDSCS